MSTPTEPGPPGAPGARKPGKLAAWVKKNPALAAGGAAGAGLIAFMLMRRNAQNAPADTAAAQDQGAAADGTAAAPGIFGDGTGADPLGSLDAQLQALTGQLAASTAANNPPPGQSKASVYALARRILQESGNAHPSQQAIMSERQRIIDQLRQPKKRPRPRRPVPPPRNRIKHPR
jgi:hypothetical protein